MANTTKIVYDGRTYTGTEIQNGNMRLATSLLSSSLESNTFNVTLKSPNKNLTNFSRNAPITVFNGERQLGIFYVQDVKRTAADLYKVSATSAVGILSDGNHYGGIYTGQTAESIIGSICGSEQAAAHKVIWLAPHCNTERQPRPSPVCDGGHSPNRLERRVTDRGAVGWAEW